MKLKLNSKPKLQKVKNSAISTIAELKSQIASAETKQELAVTKAVATVEKERDELMNKLTNKDNEHKLLESNLKERYENELKGKRRNDCLL